MGLLKGRVRWALIFWMFVVSAIAYLDRVNISIAGKAIQEEYGLTNVQLGWVFSAFIWGYALTQAPGGRMADRFGPRKILAFATVWWGVFTVLTTAVPPTVANAVLILLVVRVLLGIGEAVVYPGSNRLVSAWIPSKERGLANGIIFAGVGAGAGITPPLITYILVNYGWRYSFWMSAVLGLVAGLVWWLLVRDKPADHPWVTPAELEHIQSGLPAKTASQAKVLPWSKVFGSKDVILVSLSYASFGYVAYIFFTWFFLYLNTVRGLDLKSSSFYSMLPFIAMASCSPIGGIISDRLTKKYGKRVGRCGVAVTGLGLAAIFLGLGPLVTDARLATVVLAGGAGALYISASCFWSVTADLGGTSAGSVSGVMNMANQTAGALTAIATPVIANSFGWSAPFLVAASFCGLGALAWLFVNPDKQLAADSTPAYASAPKS